VPALVQRARDAGLPVDVRVEGEPAGVPPGVDLAAFRIVQEALANASKHAGGARAAVSVRYGEGAIEIEVRDDGRGGRAAPSHAGSGHGIAGMRERAALYGGSFQAGRGAAGGFEVRARLPLEGA
jgi:signal transduction histidine kinase